MKGRAFAILIIALGLMAAISRHPTPVLIKTPAFFPEPFPTDNPPTEEGVELGRYLFYDPILSRERKISCSTCHRQEAAFSDSPLAFSPGDNHQFGKLNTPGLFNLAWNPQFFWDGRVGTLEDQVYHPVRHPDEMGLEWAEAERRVKRSRFYRRLFDRAFPGQLIDSNLISKAIAQFERTLVSAGSKFDRVLRGEDILSPDELMGFELINDQTKGDCMHCHTTDQNALGTTAEMSNNGLPGNEVNAKFKIPSLRNLAFTAPYMHDGRFKTLEEVIDFYSSGVKAGEGVDSRMQHAHKGGVHLNEQEKLQVLAFLSTLNDSAFVSNRNFGDPWLSLKGR